MANSDILPFEFTQWHKTVSGYLNEIMAEIDQMRKNIESHNIMVSKNVFELAADPTLPFTKPVKKEEIPFIDFSPLQNQLAQLNKSITELSAKDFLKLSPTNQAVINDKLRQTEQALMSPVGLPRRSWYKHQIYAPGFYTGYGVKTLPGVREAIEQKNWKEAQEQIGVLAKTLDNFNEHIKKIIQIK